MEARLQAQQEALTFTERVKAIASTILDGARDGLIRTEVATPILAPAGYTELARTEAANLAAVYTVENGIRALEAHLVAVAAASATPEQS